MEGNEIRTADALRAAYPELVAALVKPLETETARATESVKALTVERDALKATVIAKDTEVASLAAENAGYKATETARATEAKVDSLIAASKLGDHVANKAIVSETFIGQVRACKDETSMKALIADREALVGAVPARATEGVVGAGGRSSIETGGAGDKAEEKAFLETDYFGGRLVQSANDGDIVIRLSKETLAAAGRA